MDKERPHKGVRSRVYLAMSAISKDWLHDRAPWLSSEEVDAIIDFCFLRIFFEGKSLDCRASVRQISKLGQRWEKEPRLNIADFADHIKYFKGRYCSNGSFTHVLDELNLHPSDKPDLVKAVLSGKTGKISDIITAVFIVIYRIRNNLFHGVKWATGMRGQLENFRHANAVLMKALEMDRYRESKCRCRPLMP